MDVAAVSEAGFLVWIRLGLGKISVRLFKGSNISFEILEFSPVFTILIEASTCAKQVRCTVLRRSFGAPELLRFPIFISSKCIALRVNLNS